MHEINCNEGGRSGWLPAILPPKICVGSLAHLHRTPDDETRWGLASIRVQILSPPVEVECSLTVCKHHHAVAVFACMHVLSLLLLCIIIVAILVLLLLFYILYSISAFQTSPHTTSSHCSCIYKACHFCNIQWEDPGLGWNVWIMWHWHCLIFG